MASTSQSRVVITGMGAITPAGKGVEGVRDSLVNARTGIAPITLCDTSAFPCKVAGEVKDWDADAFMDRKAARRMARFSQLMVAAAGQALSDSGIDLDAANRNRIGVLIGNG